MTDEGKKILLIIFLLIIIVLLSFLFIKVTNKNNTNYKENTKEEKIKDPVKENIDDVNTAKKNMGESNALIYIDNVEKQVMLSEVDTNAVRISAGTYSAESLENAGVSIRGETPKSNSIITIDNKKAVSEAWLEYDSYKIYFNGYNTEFVDEFSDVDLVSCVIENNNNVITNSCN